MKFEVPQFIDVEDRVFGPLTFKQFVYLAGGAGVSMVLWFFTPKLIAIPLIGVAIAFAVALAFYKYNNKPFVFLLESALRYTMSGKLYVWKKEEEKPEKKEASALPREGIAVPRISDSKLRDLAWSLDVHDSLYSESTNDQRPTTDN
ncbi:MAG: PrgI family protein [Patescibacteria group bacterium]